MSWSENPEDLPIPSAPKMQKWRWVESLETHSGRVALRVEVICWPQDHPSWNSHFYLSVGVYWPGTSPQVIRALEGSPSIKQMVDGLGTEMLLKYVNLCGWARPVSVTPSMATLYGAFSPELFRARNPWAFAPAEE